MPAFVYFSDDLLQPISAEQPCGQNLRHTPVFSEILDARRSDDVLNAGDWEKQEGRKLANWSKVASLCLNVLQTRTKDLTIIGFLGEAALNLDGFAGLHECLRLCHEILVRFWDQGLYPEVEDGDLDYRAGGMGWINNPLPDGLRQVPLTDRNGDNYSYVKYQQARQLASVSNRERQDELRRQGYITMEAFDTAVKGTRRKAFEAIYAPFDAAEKELIALERVADEKFGAAAPSFQDTKKCFSDMRSVLDPILRKKVEEEPDKAAGGQVDAPAVGTAVSSAPQHPGTAAVWSAGLPADQSQSWGEAEALIRAGKIDQGLAQMAAMAAGEASGRARFLRKLMLVDVCLGVNRERLAKTILEELKEQIVAFKLGQWESSALVGAVWSRLYRLYKKSEISSEQDQAAALYTQLCQLDPWQAYLHCED